MIKTYQGRFVPKGDTEENWNKAVGFIPLDKEIIIYKADATHSAARFKVGDGKTVVQDLPFSGTDIEAIEKLIDEKGELLIEYIDNAVAAIKIQEVDQTFDPQSEKAQSGIAITGYFNEGMNLIGEAFQYIDEVKLDKAGGLISGDVSIQGNLSVGETNTVNGNSSSAFGTNNFANNREAFVHGFGNTVNGNFAYGSGLYNVSHADISHTEGQGNVVGDLTQVEVRDVGEGGHAEGFGNLVLGKYAHAGGANNIAKGDYSKSDGIGGSDWAHPENSEIAHRVQKFDTTNYIRNTNVGHGISYTSTNNLTYFSGARFTSGTQSFAEFVSRINAGDTVKVVHSVGSSELFTVHSKGTDYFYLLGKVEWIVNDDYIDVQILRVTEDVISGTAAGTGSHVSGYHNYALQDYQTVVGKYNDNKENTLFEVGNGTDNEHRSNAFEVCTNNTAKVNGKTLATEEYVHSHVTTFVQAHKGTALYKHTLVFDDGAGTVIFVITTESENFGSNIDMKKVIRMYDSLGRTILSYKRSGTSSIDFDIKMSVIDEEGMINVIHLTQFDAMILGSQVEAI